MSDGEPPRKCQRTDQQIPCVSYAANEHAHLQEYIQHARKFVGFVGTPNQVKLFKQAYQAQMKIMDYERSSVEEARAEMDERQKLKQLVKEVQANADSLELLNLACHMLAAEHLRVRLRGWLMLFLLSKMDWTMDDLANSLTAVTRLKDCLDAVGLIQHHLLPPVEEMDLPSSQDICHLEGDLPSNPHQDKAKQVFDFVLEFTRSSPELMSLLPSRCIGDPTQTTYVWAKFFRIAKTELGQEYTLDVRYVVPLVCSTLNSRVATHLAKAVCLHLGKE